MLKFVTNCTINEADRTMYDRILRQTADHDDPLSVIIGEIEHQLKQVEAITNQAAAVANRPFTFTK